VAAATPHIGQSSPSGIVRGEGGAHDKAKASVVSATTGNLWSESEELLIDKVFRVKVAKQTRPSFDQNQLARLHPAYLVEDDSGRNHASATTNCAYLNRIGHILFEQVLRTRGRRND
jgi:hypothetical protein